MRSEKTATWKSLVSGALAGLAASWIMNEFQSVWAKAANELSSGQDSEGLSSGENATEKTAKAISEWVFCHELTASEKKWAGPAVHYSFGTSVGMVYGVLVHTLPQFRAGYGTAYGGIVWLVADEIAVPLLGLSESPLNVPVSSHAEALASHLVYAIATDLAQRAIMKL